MKDRLYGVAGWAIIFFVITAIWPDAHPLTGLGIGWIFYNGFVESAQLQKLKQESAELERKIKSKYC